MGVPVRPPVRRGDCQAWASSRSSTSTTRLVDATYSPGQIRFGSLSGTLRAENPRSIYFFTDTGIMMVQTISLGRQIVLIVGLAILYTIAFLGVALEFGAYISTDVLLVAFVISLGVVVGIPLLIPEVLRNRLLAMPLNELERRSSTLLIPWDRVDKVQVKRGVITIHTERRRYRAFSRENYIAIESFLRSKVGEKMSA